MLQTTRSQFIERNFFYFATIPLLIVAIVLIVSLNSVYATADQRESDSRIVNIAGRQRMLSQRISKNAALIAAESEPQLRVDYVDELSESTELWRDSHEGLRYGSTALDLVGDNSDDVDAMFNVLQPTYETMLNNAMCIVSVERALPEAVGCNTNLDALAGIILDEEADYLTTMNRIVFQYDEEARERAENVRLSQRLLFAGFIGLVATTALVAMVSLRLRLILQELSTSKTTVDETEIALQTFREQEQRRSRNLQAVIDLSGRVSSVLNLDQLLRDISDLTRERFGLYHAHIYQAEENRETLKLIAGAGYIGEQMVAEERTIELSNLNSIVARAGRSLGSVIVNDVRRTADFLPHPLLPATSSEMAIALQSRGQLMGVLDLQSDQADFFDEDRVVVMEAVAAQVAVAISNATLFQSLQKITAHERALGEINRTIEDASSVDEILQTTVRELGKALRIPYTAIEVQLQSDLSSSDGERAGQPL